MKNISIIIPCCNFECLKSCTKSIIDYTDLEKYDIDIIASLNGCSIESIDYIKSLGNRFRFVWVDQRIGLCRASNLAYSMCDSKYLIRMDEDVAILDWGNNIWVDMMLNPFSDEKTGQVGVVVHDRAEYKSAVGFLTMIPKNVLKQIGGWDNRFDDLRHVELTTMAEDTDISIRIQKAGYEIRQAAYCVEGKSMPFNGNFPILHISNGSWMSVSFPSN